MDNTQRDQLIAANFMGGMPVPKLALEHQLSIPTINRILSEQNVDRTQRVRGVVVEKIIDRTHERIGLRLHHHRTFVIGEDRSLCADALGWSGKKLAQVEKGHTVLNLVDLTTIAQYMKQSLSQLFEDL